jgi:hypothetical protein
MAIAPASVAASTAAALRPTARWVSTVDEKGRRRLVMKWHVPDLDEALRALSAKV